ncbi:MAG: sigma-70 family RNA polymerase sigma factor [Clostridia bacterium]|nr:sigma-70 family RNA polymerase sigma factor [Clostridia bacterium]
MFEYRTSCTERKETRYIQSLDASMDNGFDIADESVDIAKELLQKADNERLYAAMEHLTEKQYLILWLNAVEGLSFREIGRRFGISKTTVVEQFNAAVKKIRKNF